MFRKCIIVQLSVVLNGFGVPDAQLIFLHRSPRELEPYVVCVKVIIFNILVKEKKYGDSSGNSYFRVLWYRILFFSNFISESVGTSLVHSK